MVDVATKSVEGLLTLTRLRGVGPATAERIAESFESLEALRTAAPTKLKTIASAAVSEVLQQSSSLRDAHDQASRLLERADKIGVRIISVFDVAYPEALRPLADRPTILYVRGHLPSRRAAACIGTREPTDFGETVTDRIVQQLVAADWHIVSGLALGVDTLAHQAALRHGGKTTAVMAGGLDGIYPKANARLADEVLETGGGLVSEQPFGVPPSPRNLVQRDRLQSGLSVGTFVMQTDVKGGSMHTVRFTLMQGRLLFAPVPMGRHAEEAKSQGILALSQQPAHRLAELLRVEGDYRRLLVSRIGSRPVAIPLAGREDYAAMLGRLEARLAEEPAFASAARASQPSFL
jgi:DNA processing protein